MKPPRVLIVEDEYLVAADLEAALIERGYASIGIAQDLETAIQLAQTRPDIALVDVHLRDGATGPVIGRQLADRFGVKVVFVTANPAMVAQAAGAGVIGVSNKPCQEDLVVAALAYALGRTALPAPPAGLMLLDAP